MRGVMSTVRWSAPGVQSLRKQLLKVGRILAWGASEIWAARSLQPLHAEIHAGLSGPFSELTSYYPAFGRVGPSPQRGTGVGGGHRFHQRASSLPAHGSRDISIQQHRDRVRNLHQRDRRAALAAHGVSGATGAARTLAVLGTITAFFASSHAIRFPSRNIRPTTVVGPIRRHLFERLPPFDLSSNRPTPPPCCVWSTPINATDHPIFIVLPQGVGSGTISFLSFSVVQGCVVPSDTPTRNTSRKSQPLPTKLLPRKGEG